MISGLDPRGEECANFGVLGGSGNANVLVSGASSVISHLQTLAAGDNRWRICQVVVYS